MPNSIRRLLVVALWAAAFSAIWVSVDQGRELQRTAPEIFLGAAPLVGRNFRDGWDWRFGWSLIGAGALVSIVVTAVACGWVNRMRLRIVVAATSLLAGLFAVLLALTDGNDGLLFGAVDDTEYLANLSAAPPAGEFVRTFVDNIDDYSVHVRGHPPGFVVLLKFLDALGLSGAWPVVAVSLLATVAVPAAVLVAVWAVAGPTLVRWCAPFLIVAPYALWMMTSADALYSALGAWGVALITLGIAQRGLRSVLLGAAGGLLLSSLLFMSYGGAIFVLVPLTVVGFGLVIKSPGTARTVGGAVVAALVVTSVWCVAGFWWFDGAAVTREEYWEGSAQFRIWNYFIFANLAAALIAVGPATFVGLTKLRDRRLWVLVGGGLLGLIAANLSQLSKGEVERIWLLFYPWIVIAGAGLVRHVEVRIPRRRAFRVSRNVSWAVWVGLQATFTVLLQAALVSKW